MPRHHLEEDRSRPGAPGNSRAASPNTFQPTVEARLLGGPLVVRRRRDNRVIPVILALVLLVGWAAPALSGDDVILNANRFPILAGRYSVFAEFQRNLQRVLDACGKEVPTVVERGKEPTGRVGTETRLGIQAALGCEPLRAVRPDSAANDGVLTEAVWRAVMDGAPIPGLRDRVMAQILSYEATDFGDRPEWNLCQDSKGRRGAQLDPKAPGFICYNASDPCSMLTWGPRGATAGSGREIQWVLWMAWKEDPASIEKAFGAEFAHLRRFFRLQSGASDRICREVTPLRRFMCAVWVDPKRRRIWEEALVNLGHVPMVRRAYDRLYSLNEFDGGKLRAFFNLWARLGLAPNEVDYAFFMDRATHLGGPPEAVAETVDRLSKCMEKDNRAIFRNAAARRCLSRWQRHDTQPELRMARDVGFYLDAYPEGVLTDAEIKSWGGYIPLSAVHNFGLSESKLVQIEDAPGLDSLGSDLPIADASGVTPEEARACPTVILTPVRRRPRD